MDALSSVLEAKVWGQGLQAGFPSLLLLASGGSCQSSAFFSLHGGVVWAVFSCRSPLYKKTVALGQSPSVWPHLHLLHLQRPRFQIKSCSQVLPTWACSLRGHNPTPAAGLSVHKHSFCWLPFIVNEASLPDSVPWASFLPAGSCHWKAIA